MKRTRRIIIAAMALGGTVLALFGLGANETEDEPKPSPGPRPNLPPRTPAEPILIPPDTIPPDEPGDVPGADDLAPEPPPVTPPPVTPPPSTPPADTNTSGKWGPRHALLETLGYWTGPTAVPASAKTVNAIRAFQLDVEAARPQVAGLSQSAAILSDTYKQVIPDGKWGPEVAQWAAWARDNYPLFYQSVQATAGHAPGEGPSFS